MNRNQNQSKAYIKWKSKLKRYAVILGLILVLIILAGQILIQAQDFVSRMLGVQPSSAGLHLQYSDDDRDIENNYWLNTEFAFLEPIDPYRTAVGCLDDEEDVVYSSLDGSIVKWNFWPTLLEQSPSIIAQLVRIRIASESGSMGKILIPMEAKSGNYPLDIYMYTMDEDGLPLTLCPGMMHYLTDDDDIDDYNVVEALPDITEGPIEWDTTLYPTEDNYYFLAFGFGSDSGGGYLFGCNELNVPTPPVPPEPEPIDWWEFLTDNVTAVILAGLGLAGVIVTSLVSRAKETRREVEKWWKKYVGNGSKGKGKK
jgi:hypothetical protein